jgi:hypothetical protein
MALVQQQKEVFIVRMKDGVRVYDLEPSALTWGTRLNKAGSISVDIRIGSSAVDEVAVKEFTKPKKYGLVIMVDGELQEGGHITTRTFSDDAKSVSVTAVGLWTYLDWVRVWSPTFNRSTGDPKDDTVTISGSWRGISAALIMNAVNNPDGEATLPPVFSPYVGEAGTQSKTYKGADGTTLGEALSEIIDAGGPDQEFVPVWTNESRTGVIWEHRAGAPLLMQAGNPHVFDHITRSLLRSSPVSGWMRTGRPSRRVSGPLAPVRTISRPSLLERIRFSSMMTIRFLKPR